MIKFRHYVEKRELPPRFHLPVRYIPCRLATETWFFPLAPFVLLFYAVRNSFRIIWMDLVRLLHDTEDLINKKNKL